MAALEAPEVRRTTVRLRQRWPELPSAQLVGVLALASAVAITVPGYLTLTNIYSTLILAAFLGVGATGQTVIVLLGGIDLSVPALITGANLVTAMFSGRGWNIAPAIAAVLAGCVVVGLVNGVLIGRLALSSLIVTIATGALVGGVTLAWTHSGLGAGALPPWLSSFSSPIGETAGLRVPPVLVLWLLVILAMAIVLRWSVLGRRLYATGANQRAAELAGVRTHRVWAGAFVLSAVSAGLVGVLLAGFIGTAQAGIGDPYLFSSLTAVFIGGTSFVGARGSYGRTVLGALMLTLMTTMLVAHGVGVSTQEAMFGVLILVANLAYGRDRRVRDRI